MKRYLNPFRVTTYLLVLYALGHTFGALVATPRFGSESDAVVSAMKSVHVKSGLFDCTWYGFYLGFGYLVSVFFLFSAALTWFLGGLSPREQRSWSFVSWSLLVSYGANTAITWHYFFTAPIVFSTVITALLGFQCVKLSNAANERP